METKAYLGIGLTLRDYFAASALEGIIAHPGMDPDDSSPTGCAELAYAFANAMLAVREPKQPDPEAK